MGEPAHKAMMASFPRKHSRGMEEETSSNQRSTREKGKEAERVELLSVLMLKIVTKALEEVANTSIKRNESMSKTWKKVAVLKHHHLAPLEVEMLMNT